MEPLLPDESDNKKKKKNFLASKAKDYSEKNPTTPPKKKAKDPLEGLKGLELSIKRYDLGLEKAGESKWKPEKREVAPLWSPPNKRKT
mmetsp:Transcript_22542/g.34839  ORF Transcript_22542/g.34839 Transcript_22542/m.34839 type:complete len:88 (-) Transcript_22542:36-299(-)